MPGFQSFLFGPPIKNLWSSRTLQNDNLYASESPDELFKRAAELREEARQMESELKKKSIVKKDNTQKFVGMLFQNNRPLTPEALARTITEQRLSEDQLEGVIEHLYQTENSTNYISLLLESTKVLDNRQSDRPHRWSGRVSKSLSSKLMELVREADLNWKRSLLLNQTTRQQPEPVAAQRNSTTVVPTWLPSSLLFLLSSNYTINSTDIHLLENVLSRTRFFCTDMRYTKNAAIYYGNMRPNTPGPVDEGFPSTVFAEIHRELKNNGLSDTLRLFLLPDPGWRPPGRGASTGELSPKPVILAIPKAYSADYGVLRPKRNRGIAMAGVCALLTTFFFSVSCYALNESLFRAVVYSNKLRAVWRCWPIVAGTLVIHATHEVIHHAVARWHGIKLAKPRPIPSFRFGMFGSITPLKSFPKNRSALLDVALSGPMAASLLSVCFMVFGCYRTAYASNAALLDYPMVPAATLKSSFVAGTIISFLLPKAFLLPQSQPIPIHPMFMVGLAGLMASALNLLPACRLDGGRACAAALGSRVAVITSAWTLLSMFSVCLSSSSSYLLSWLLLILFFQRRSEVPAVDEVTPVSDFRIGAWIVSLATSALSLLAFP